MGVPFQVTFDALDPAALSRFWGEALGYKLQDPPPGHATWEDFLRSIGVPEEDRNSASAVVDPDGEGPRLYFQRVPEKKAAKNRVHLDVNVGRGRDTPEEERRSRVEAAAQRLVEFGATQGRTFEERDEYWIVMSDPEGNEFCLQ